ncbi:hypothetical protein OUZ56_027851 [Daphnia magna]|uniref:Uncharacterized protein n=1 Tax=Daphnia magna TaxID=35525 RepID=A0ABR0B243_9CRUS|nr:hypothetical protein OUZ56_027851 [Daphnia magna]
MIEYIYIVSAMRSGQTGGSWHVRGLQVVDSATGFGTRTAPIRCRTDGPQVVVDVVVGLHQDSLLLATSVYASWKAREKKTRKKKRRKYIKMGVIKVRQQSGSSKTTPGLKRPCPLATEEDEKIREKNENTNQINEN